MSRSCPFHSFQLPLHVPDIFSVCPLHFPCMSRSCVASHFPTSPVVPIGFLVLCFPFIPPALPLFSFLSLSCPFQFPFVSLSFPVAFLSCRRPISGKRRQEAKPAKEPAGGIEPGTPFATPAPRRLRLVELHQIAARYVGPPKTYVSDVGRGGGVRGGVILYPLVSIRRAKQCRRISNITFG